ncbi:hypothetical protein Dimus_005577 [Dionaea muscipula]
MGLSSPDPGDYSSSEGMELSEATVSSMEADDLSDLEDGKLISSHVLELSPIMEVDGLPEVSISPGSGSPVLSPTSAVLFCQASVEAGGVDLFRDGANTGVASAVSIAEVDGANDGDALDVAGEVVGFGAAPGFSSAADGEFRCPTVTLGDDLCNEFDSVNISNPSSTVAAINVGGVQVTEAVSHLSLFSDVDAVVGGETLSGEEQTPEFSNSRVDSLMPRLSDVVGLCGGGMVSEEGLVLPVARGALRPQPADGLRQPVSSPVEPVSVVEGGVGQDGCSGGRSYAHVVQVDRRADVKLSYLPPFGGGNTITMEESDGDNLQWGSCLVGHFHSGYFAFWFC